MTPIKLNEWAKRHGVTPEALAELQQLFTQPTDVPHSMSGASEAAVLNAVRLEASRIGVRLYRNQVGACEDKNGRQIRYGWMNDSKKMNEHIKSGDLIGIRPVLITQEMVGCTIGQFVMREVKRANWKYTGTSHEIAQLRCLEFVVSLGGDACFCNDVGSL